MAAHEASVWSRLSADPRDPVSAELRATDADRHTVNSVLADAYADGRLDRAEYDERSQQALATKRLGDFLSLLRDLTPEVPIVPGPASDDLQAQAERRYAKELRDSRNGFLSVTIMTVVIWAATSIGSGGAYFFWPIFPALGTGIGYFMIRLNKESKIEEHRDRLVTKRRKEIENG